MFVVVDLECVDGESFMANCVVICFVGQTRIMKNLL